MDERVKKLWVKALRSGKYKQAKKRLRQDRAGVVRMCCLGVLCEVFRKTEKRGQWIHGRGGWVFMVGDSAAKTVTHGTVAEWAELPDDNPDVPVGTFSDSLGALNDQGRDFSYIADRIEKHL